MAVKGIILGEPKYFLTSSYNFEDDYLSMFKIYCLVNEKKIEEAQLLLDLKKEQGWSLLVMLEDSQ